MDKDRFLFSVNVYVFIPMVLFYSEKLLKIVKYMGMGEIFLFGI